MKNTKHQHRAFTLIELLVVIAIIGILAGLLFPTISQAILKAKMGQAQALVSGLATAFQAYYTEYGKWPTATTLTDSAGSGIYYVNTNIFATASNPRNLVFFDFPSKDLDPLNGGGGRYLSTFKDTQGRRIPFQCAFDTTYVNQIQNPYYGLSGQPQYIQNGFLVWLTVTNQGIKTAITSWGSTFRLP